MGLTLSNTLFAHAIPPLRAANQKKLDETNLPPLQTRDAPSDAHTLFQAAHGNHARTKLWAVVRTPAMLSAFCYLLYVACSFAGPLLLQRLLVVLACRAAGGTDCEPLNAGYGYAAGLFGTRAFGSLFLNHAEMLMTRAALRARGALMIALYRKCLVLAGVGAASTGQIQALMSIDAEVVLMIAPVLNMLWASPLQVVAILIWLAFILGPSTVVAVGVLFLFVPLQGFVTKKLLSYRRKQLKFTDVRVKLTNELVQGVRVVKLCGWEDAMRERIVELRKQELAVVRKTRFISAIFSMLLVAQPLLVTVVTFSVYKALGNPLAAPTVVTALALLTMLRFPLVFLPFIIIQTLNLKVSLERVGKFLANKEVKGTADAAPDTAADAASDKKAHTSTKTAAGGGAPVVADTDAIVLDALPEISPTPEAKDELDPVDVSETAAYEPNIVLRGSWRWEPPEVPVGKGKGKGGAGGKGGRGRGGGGAAPATADTGVVPARGRRFGRRGRGSSTRAPAGADATAAGKPADAKKPVEPALIDLDLDLKPGKLTMVAGAVGSGKSSLLGALLGEMVSEPNSNAHATLSKQTVALVAQTAFICSNTLRENILFGLPMDEEWYEAVIDACALHPDLKILPGGDMTGIGEKGVNVSGGQKARISLARACYSRADVYLLDDPLSAVDPHVGRHLFQNVLGPRGLLAGKTRLLITHQTQFLPLADEVLMLDAGRVELRGSYTELTRGAGRDHPLLKDIEHESADSHDEVGSAFRETKESADSKDSNDAAKSAHGEGATPDKGASSSDVVAAGDAKKAASGARLVELEERQTGAIPASVFKDYIAAGGGFGILSAIILLCVFDRSMTVGTDVWLSLWIGGESAVNGTYPIASPDALELWVPVYVAFAVVAGAAVFGRSIVMLVGMGVRAARELHHKLLGAVLDAPMVFFETTPSGRILNRFTFDTEMIDNTVLQNLQQWTNTILPVVSTLIFVSVESPIFLAWIFVLATIYVLVYRWSVSGTRDIQRLNQVSRSPIFSHFSETLNGLSTIRAYGAGRRFESASTKLIFDNTRAAYSQYLVSAWVSLSLELMAAAIVFAAALLPVISVSRGVPINVALAGIAVTYTLELSGFLKHATRMTLEVQKSFAGIERIMEYIDHAPKESLAGESPPSAKDWPSDGRIVVHKLSARYRPELPFALNDVSCVIPPAAKIGIVGRTGSGKSTFLATLWRIVEPSGGNDGAGAGAICIDGADLKVFALRELRRRLAIIPQDPVLFADTVRYNLDPFGESTDERLIEVLELVQLGETIRALPDGLNHKVSEEGANFSVGQRQLLCLARATLRQSRVLALDEATASIDNETDSILQLAIRKEFSECTVLTIAHRLHTIVDSTAVMVFEQGRLAEYAEPAALLDDKSSLFSQMVERTGAAASHLRKAAYEARSERAAGKK